MSKVQEITQVNPYTHLGTEKPTKGNVLVSYDGGKNWDNTVEWCENRTCMMAGIAGGCGYFDEGWGTSKNSQSDIGLICDAPDFWRYEHENEEWTHAQALLFKSTHYEHEQWSTEDLIDCLPQNSPLYKDSGLWQIRTDDMTNVHMQQRPGETLRGFVIRYLEWLEEFEDITEVRIDLSNRKMNS